MTAAPAQPTASITATAAMLLMTWGAAGCSQPVYRTRTDPLQTVAALDLDRYQGLWFEIARLPNSFEDADCETVTAHYRRRDDGLIAVRNTCAKAGSVDRSEGVARIPDPKQPAKLEVSFFRPFYGNYWVIDLDADYGWALVAEPEGKYLWLLARTPKLSAELERELLARIAALGYPTDALIRPTNTRPPTSP